MKFDSRLLEQRETWRSRGKRVVFTNGCFDLLHPGHIAYLTEAKALGDVLVVGLNSDASVRRLKGPKRPLLSQEERRTMLLALRMVDDVAIFDEDTPNALIAALKPDIHVKGGDYNVDDLPETAVVRAYGGEVKILKFLDGFSTSGIIERILKRYDH